MELARKALNRFSSPLTGLKDDDDYYDKGKRFFCGSCLYGCFDDIPKDVIRIDLILYDCTSVDRLKLQQRGLYCDIKVDGKYKTPYFYFEQWLQAHMPKSEVCYLQVEY